MSDRINKLRKKLPPERIDTVLISSSHNIAYLTGFFGFSAIEREGYLLVTAQTVYFFASGLNSRAVEKHIAATPGVALRIISPRAPLSKKVLLDVVKRERIKRLGFEKYSLGFWEYERLQKDLKVTLVPTAHLVEKLRMIKGSKEIAAIENACKLGDKAFEHILKKIKTGSTEKQLAFEIEIFIKKSGADISFPPIVAFGGNSATPHHRTSDQKLKPGDSVLMDFGVKVDNYCSDMTRTVFFGRPTTKQRKMYKAVLDAQQKAFEYVLSNMYYLIFSNHKSSILHHRSKGKTLRACDVDKIARTHITSKGYPTIPHSLGHGIGLEVHEPPRLSIKTKDILQTGMVFSIEPGVYFPGMGGVRIEDLVVLEESGPRFLTHSQRELITI